MKEIEELINTVLDCWAENKREVVFDTAFCGLILIILTCSVKC